MHIINDNVQEQLGKPSNVPQDVTMYSIEADDGLGSFMLIKDKDGYFIPNKTLTDSLCAAAGYHTLSDEFVYLAQDYAEKNLDADTVAKSVGLQ